MHTYHAPATDSKAVTDSIDMDGIISVNATRRGAIWGVFGVLGA